MLRLPLKISPDGILTDFSRLFGTKEEVGLTLALHVLPFLVPAEEGISLTGVSILRFRSSVPGIMQHVAVSASSTAHRPIVDREQST